MLKTLSTLIIFVAALFSISTTAFAGNWELDVYGLTIIHKKTFEPEHLANKLDDDGTYNLNLGLGLGYDFRQNAEKEGLSPIIKGGWYLDLHNLSKFYIAGGGRWRNYYGPVFVDLNIGYGFIGGKSRSYTYYTQGDTVVDSDVETDTYIDFVPLLSLGVGFPVFSKNVMIGLTTLDSTNEFTLFSTIDI